MLTNKNMTLTKKLLYIYFYLLFIIPLISQIVSGFFSYIFDALTLILLFIFIIEYKNKIKPIKLFIPIFILFIYVISTSIMNSIPTLLFVWGARNLFRFYFITYIVYNTFSFNDVCKIKNDLYLIGIINFFVCVIELLLGYRWDYLGGLFGIQKGGNSYLTSFLVILNTIAVNDYFRGNLKTSKLVFILLTTILEMAFGEMKFCIILLVFIIFISLLMNGGLRKKNNLILFFISVVLIFFGTTLLSTLFSNSKLSVDFFIKYFEKASYGYNGIGDVNRTTFISVLDKKLNSNLFHKFFGYGLGYGEVSNFSFFTSPFGTNNADLLHYNWFMSSFQYLEIGLFGMALYICFLIVFAVNTIKYGNSERKIFFIIILNGIMLYFYCTSLRDTFGGLLFYFVLPFGLINDDKQSKNEIDLYNGGK